MSMRRWGEPLECTYAVKWAQCDWCRYRHPQRVSAWTILIPPLTITYFAVGLVPKSALGCLLSQLMWTTITAGFIWWQGALGLLLFPLPDHSVTDLPSQVFLFVLYCLVSSETGTVPPIVVTWQQKLNWRFKKYIY